MVVNVSTGAASAPVCPESKPKVVSQTLESAENWVGLIVSLIDFPDERLNERLSRILMTFISNPDCSIPQAFAKSSQAKAAYRFFDNKRVTVAAVVAGFAAVTVRACAGLDMVYIVQDTTTISYSNLKTTTGLGSVNDSETARGLLVHTTMAVDKQGTPLGLLGLRIWAREPDKKTAADRKRPLEEKESYKWFGGADAAHQAFDCLPAEQRPRLVHMTDGEGDIHELFSKLLNAGEGFIIRGAQDRCVEANDEKIDTALEVANESAEKAYAAVRQTPSLGTHRIQLQPRDGKPGRFATVEVRACTVTLDPSAHYPGREPLTLSMVEAHEPNPPAGSKAVTWRLWTDEPVTSLSQAIDTLNRYGFRWRVEDYHHVLKSGCRVEKLELETAARLKIALATYAAVALRIVTLRDAARRDPDSSCEQFLTKDEWRVLARNFDPTRKDPQPPTMKQAMLWIGQLGGHIRCKRATMPGVKTIWRGYRALMLMIVGYRLR